MEFVEPNTIVSGSLDGLFKIWDYTAKVLLNTIDLIGRNLAYVNSTHFVLATSRNIYLYSSINFSQIKNFTWNG